MNLRAKIGSNSGVRPVMYATAFDLDTSVLEQTHHNDPWRNAYSDVRKALEGHGFERVQGSIYFGNDKVDAVTCVLAVQALAADFDWFGSAVKDIRMLRTQDNNDLGPAVDRALAMKK